MAVKQNTEPNASPSAVASKTVSGTAAKSNMPNAAQQTNKKMQQQHQLQKLDAGIVNNDEETDYQMDCGADDNTDDLMETVGDDAEQQHHSLNTQDANTDDSKSGMEVILHYLHVLEHAPARLYNGEEILQVYQNLIANLSFVEVPLEPPAINNFKRDIQKVAEFFARSNDKPLYFLYLRMVYQIISSSEMRKPSCALAIIFHIFSEEMVFEAVQSLLHTEIPEQNIRKTVSVLCDWLRECFFCSNISCWIMAILTGLLELQKLQLFEVIALENIEKVFDLFALPALRPRAAPVVFQLLCTIQHTPAIFQRILAKFPFIISCLKKQNDTRFLQQLVNLAFLLMNRFDRDSDKYDKLHKALKGMQPSQKLEFYANCNNEWHGDNTGKVGLTNLGNTCYMNSVLQALANTRDFSRHILLCTSPQPVIVKMKQQIALMLYSNREELTPTRILNATRPPGFLAGLQQDSSEFLSYLLEILHEQEVVFYKSLHQLAMQQLSERNQQQDDDTHGIETVAALPTAVSKSQLIAAATLPLQQSTIEKTFSGKLATTYKCLTCNMKSINVDSFRDLQLSFPEMESDCASNYSVQDLIDYYCSAEKLYGDNQYFCERCKRLTDAVRYINVISAPKNLILTLKHFKYDQKYHMRAKLMHKVFHDEKVNLKVCSEQTTEEIATVHYDLYAGVVHSGYSMDSGHYYTYAADANNQWYKYNDSVVTLSNTEDLHNLTPPNTPYILFYQMSAQTNSSMPDASAVVQINAEPPLLLEQLPDPLRDYVLRDSCAFTEELIKERLYRNTRNSARRADKPDISRGDAFDDDDDNGDNDDNPPPSSGCGDNAININSNRFVF